MSDLNKTIGMENKVCPNCGVILDDGLKECPLCNKPAQTKHERRGDELYPSDILNLTSKRNRIYAWELSAIIAFSASLICIIVDLVIVKGINWSLFAVTGICGVWSIITAFTYFHKRPVILGFTLALSTLAMLAVFDILDPPLNWFVGLGLPISVAFWILFASFLLILRKLKWKGFNMLAYVFFEISALCIVIDIFTDKYFKDNVFIDWSAITSATLVPIAGVLFFIHYRMKRGSDLRSFFHV